MGNGRQDYGRGGAGLPSAEVEPPNIPTWGNMLTAASEHMSDLPLLVIEPGMALTLVDVSLHLLGDCLRDALDPRFRE